MDVHVPHYTRIERHSQVIRHIGLKGCCIIFAACLALIFAQACSQGRQTLTTPTHYATSTARSTVMPTPLRPTAIPATSTAVLDTPTPMVTATLTGPAVTDVQFALDVEQTGELIFPAAEFVFGVTRVYVRFVYQGLEDVTQVESNWYLNENRVSSGTLTWDGGEAGAYIIWIEDPAGLERGQWRWELAVDKTPLGGGEFAIGGEPRYINESWGLSFDPPVTWQLNSEQENVVTFSSPNRRQALALRVALDVTDLQEIPATDLASFQQEHPDAGVVATEDVTLGGEKGVLWQVRFEDQDGGEQYVFIVSALHSGSVYSLWMLGPVDDVAALRAQLFITLRSIRFLTYE